MQKLLDAFYSPSACSSKPTPNFYNYCSSFSSLKDFNISLIYSEDFLRWRSTRRIFVGDSNTYCLKASDLANSELLAQNSPRLRCDYSIIWSIFYGVLLPLNSLSSRYMMRHLSSCYFLNDSRPLPTNSAYLCSFSADKATGGRSTWASASQLQMFLVSAFFRRRNYMLSRLSFSRICESKQDYLRCGPVVLISGIFIFLLWSRALSSAIVQKGLLLYVFCLQVCTSVSLFLLLCFLPDLLGLSAGWALRLSLNSSSVLSRLGVRSVLILVETVWHLVSQSLCECRHIYYYLVDFCAFLLVLLLEHDFLAGDVFSTCFLLVLRGDTFGYCLVTTFRALFYFPGLIWLQACVLARGAFLGFTVMQERGSASLDLL